MPYNLRKRKAESPKAEPVKPAKAPKTSKTSKTLPKATKAQEVEKDVVKPAEELNEPEEVEVKPRKPVRQSKTSTAPKVTKAPRAPKATKAVKEPIAPKEPKVPRTTKTTKVLTKAPKVEEEPEDEPMEELEEQEEKVKEETKSEKLTEPTETAETIEQPDADRKKVKLTSKLQLIFGEDTCGELGQGDIGITRKKPSKINFDSEDQGVLYVACGPVHTLSLTTNGKVYSFGCNDEGALGRVTDGDEKLEATPAIVPIEERVVKITAGDSHSAALTYDGKIYVWGNLRDEHGTVGLTPECDGKSSYEPIHLLPEVKFKDMASGSNHMLLLDEEGAVYSFGVGAQGQLGRLTTDDVGEGINCKPITAENRDLFLRPQKVNLKNVDPQRPFVCDAVFAGNFSSFATNTDKKKNRLAGWGLNNYFQLGYKGQKGQLVQHFPKRSTFTCSTSMRAVACGPHHTIFLTKTGRVYTAGRNEYGMLGLTAKSGGEVCPAKCIENLGNSIIDISAGINTSFAVSDDGSLYAWGMGGLNLGLKNDQDLTEPTKVDSLADNKVLSVSTGGTFTSVLVESK